ncbi:hypothetical protein FE697_005035 [Mumia zhuanghuii]|uniref:Nuclear transport factor 2 family protein n=2 Tax=Mumia TaxID=1546255 RepID=A0ABW1QQ84_9ACTN|nr:MULTISPECIES: hypothetical protein [Mumia]KAA1425235.1 hypothetical protein FE697_005035 [Mumia zhuanghuii]
MSAHAGSGRRRGTVPVVVAMVVVGLGVALLSLTTSTGSSGLPARPSAAAAESWSGSPSETLERMLRALGTGEVEAACSVAAPDGFPITTISGQRRCQRELRAKLDDLDPRLLEAYRDIEVRGATVEGNSATVRPHQVVGAPVAMLNAVFVLVEAGDSWYVVV